MERQLEKVVLEKERVEREESEISTTAPLPDSLTIRSNTVSLEIVTRRVYGWM